jgi:hypothetical protein
MMRVPSKDELTICFAHVAYRLRERFLTLATGIESFDVRDGAALEQRIGEADVLVISGLWRNDLLPRAKRLRFIQSIDQWHSIIGSRVRWRRDVREGGTHLLEVASFQFSQRRPMPNGLPSHHSGLAEAEVCETYDCNKGAAIDEITQARSDLRWWRDWRRDRVLHKPTRRTCDRHRALRGRWGGVRQVGRFSSIRLVPGYPAGSTGTA